MLTIVTLLHIVVCIILSIVILMQSSKGGGLSGAFGGQGSMGAVFGGRGAGSFLSKVTVVLAIVFMLGSIAQGLIKRGTRESKSLIREEAQKEGTVSAADMLPPIQGEQPQGITPQAPSKQQSATSGKVDTSK